MPKLISGISTDVSLKDHSSWKVGGKAEFYAQPKDFVEVEALYNWALENNQPISVLSGGTNVLISEQGVPGLVFSMRALNKVESSAEQDSRLKIIAQTGAPKSELLKLFLKFKLAPALFLAGLPGDLGGGIAMNAGVGEARTPREFCEIIDWIDVLQPGQKNKSCKIQRLTSKQLHWSYRHSSGWQPGIILRAQLSWPLEADVEIMTKIKEATKNRIQRQPLDKPSCGSTFRNPPQHKAGQLIESSGLKGFRIGGAEVSTKHANFIVTDASANASHVYSLISHVKKTVLEKHNVELIPEVVLMGKF